MLNVYVIDQTTHAGIEYYQKCHGWYGDNNQVVFSYDQVDWMQFTGLTDKNGKEIYEGDLVAIAADNFDVLSAGHEIVFGNYCIGQDEWGVEHTTACFCVKFNDGSGYHGIPKEVIVIGNIYEHPHLINKPETA